VVLAIRRCAMKNNMGSPDRIIRLIIGVILAILALAKIVTGAGAVVLGIIAIILILTGIIGFCPLYVFLKMSTTKKPSA
jgi:heme/copper-type cytochrome/quinol oxidase subunit 4